MPVPQPIDRRSTPLGEIVLRRVELPQVGTAWEIFLDGALLVTSLVDDGERALAERALAATEKRDLDVLVGGLGLGTTAAAALDDPRVASVVVLERIEAVVAWHQQRRLPRAERLVDDPRVTLLVGDFFELVAQAGPRYDVILVDIDHSPRAHLAPAHAAFYTEEGLAGVRQRLHPGGVLGLWSGDTEDGAFMARLQAVFGQARCETVRFHNPQAGGVDVNTIYVARRAARGRAPTGW